MLVLASLGEAAGKTAFAAALGKGWQEAGKRIGYVKLRRAVAEDGAAEPDAEFLRRALGPAAGEAAALAIPPGELQRAAESFRDHDVVLVEPAGHLGEPGPRDAVLPIAISGAKVLLVVRYWQKIGADPIQEATEELGQPLAGVVLNGVPARFIPVVRENVVANLEETSIPVLGVLPETRALFGFSVGELADYLHAEYLCMPEKREDLIENLMLGGNPPDVAYSYYQSKPSKAVFCRIDRPDIQLAALDTSVRCLVFTGEGYLQTSVVYRAEDLGVPILRVPTDTITTVKRLTGLVEGVRFRQVEKVPIMRGLVEQHLDLARLVEALEGS